VPISISVQHLAELRRDHTPHILLDVREADELEICQLENALHIPMSQVPARLADLPSDQPIVVMCHHGGRSLRVVQFLRQAGRDNAINLDGGIESWALEIDPSIARY
jgi:rhodanese-related sulfurtransferase